MLACVDAAAWARFMKPRAPRGAPRAWDERHHLCDSQNELKPQQLREYFSRPQSLPELRREMKRRPNCRSNLRKLEKEEPPQLISFLTADAGPSVCPQRHQQGGEMLDRDGNQMPWNNRWSAGIHILNAPQAFASHQRCVERR